jgi:hypothetical protein
MVANKSFANTKSLANDSNKSRQNQGAVQNMIAYIHFNTVTFHPFIPKQKCQNNKTTTVLLLRGCKTRSLTLRKEGLKLSEKKILGRTSRPNSELEKTT